GVNIHPGIAKGAMVNAVRIASEFIHRLPADQLSPATTDGRDGFLHPGEAPGHGVDFDEQLAARYPYRRAYLPVNRLAHDGTLWDW
ncbi:MAG: peptidase dimerization domain-containing protein, partial [Burkholderiaceae bacterium]|nr:peptidase dimerization domain-containing protein [Burkholderiaceae bacterium]